MKAKGARKSARRDRALVDPLAKPLDRRQRRQAQAIVRGVLAFHGSLDGFPKLVSRGLPDATPFVSIYVNGQLRGCFGSDDGDPAERLARATLLALHDARFGSIAPDERKISAAEVAYPKSLRPMSLSDAARTLEPGTHGLAWAHSGGPAIVLLPNVACDERLGTSELIARVAKKAGIPTADLAQGELWVFEVERVVSGVSVDAASADPIELGASWLGDRIHSDGSIEFGWDPRTGECFPRGEFFHARAALVIFALAQNPKYAKKIARARAWLETELVRGLRGKSVLCFPEHPAQIAAALALAVRAGIDVNQALRNLARNARIPWPAPQAAQVVSVLGRDAPSALFDACVRDLDAQPWAPWTAIAARAMGDLRVVERAETAVVESIRHHAPYAGSADLGFMPELALTALAAEALALSTDKIARAALGRARRFLLDWQLGEQSLSAALDPKIALGAFPLSPVDSKLRTDVTAHALLALE